MTVRERKPEREWIKGGAARLPGRRENALPGQPED